MGGDALATPTRADQTCPTADSRSVMCATAPAARPGAAIPVLLSAMAAPPPARLFDELMSTMRTAAKCIEHACRHAGIEFIDETAAVQACGCENDENSANGYSFN